MASKQQFVKVKDSSFKAAGDGVTDDTAALQRALKAAQKPLDGAGGAVHFPPGTYRIKSSLQVGSTRGSPSPDAKER